jgi:hypothetical protein
VLDSKILDVAMGVILMYLAISLICSALTEGISRIFKLRSEFLMRGITRLLQDPDLAKDVMAHPLITGMQENGLVATAGVTKKTMPSYLAANIFRM